MEKRTLRIGVVSSGTPEGTSLVDLDTGEPIDIEGAHVHIDAHHGHELHGTCAEVTVRLAAPLSTTSETPFSLYGCGRD